MLKKHKLSLREYNLREQVEILTSPLNYWGTGQDIGHQPNPSDESDRNALFINWIKNGGRDAFKERFEIKVPIGAKIGCVSRKFLARVGGILKAEIGLKRSAAHCTS